MFIGVVFSDNINENKKQKVMKLFHEHSKNAKILPAGSSPTVQILDENTIKNFVDNQYNCLVATPIAIQQILENDLDIQSLAENKSIFLNLFLLGKKIHIGPKELKNFPKLKNYIKLMGGVIVDKNPAIYIADKHLDSNEKEVTFVKPEWIENLSCSEFYIEPKDYSPPRPARPSKSRNSSKKSTRSKSRDTCNIKACIKTYGSDSILEIKDQNLSEDNQHSKTFSTSFFNETLSQNDKISVKKEKRESHSISESSQISGLKSETLPQMIEKILNCNSSSGSKEKTILSDQKSKEPSFLSQDSKQRKHAIGQRNPSSLSQGSKLITKPKKKRTKSKIMEDPNIVKMDRFFSNCNQEKVMLYDLCQNLMRTNSRQSFGFQSSTNSIDSISSCSQKDKSDSDDGNYQIEYKSDENLKNNNESQDTFLSLIQPTN